MAEDTELNEDTIIPILDDLRKPNGKKPRNGKVSPKRKLKTFDDIVSDEWNNLGLEGEPNLKLIELIIINSIEELYGGWNQETDETERKKKARMRDANLLSFGLLDEYYHTEEGANTWLSDRYEEYLKKTDFVKIDYPGEGPYEEIARKDKIRKPGKQPRPLGSLTHFVSDGKEEIASKVFEIIHNKTYKTYLDKDGKVPAFELPKPCYTLKNFPLPTDDGLEDNVLIRGGDEPRKLEAQEKDTSESDKDEILAEEIQSSDKTEGQESKEPREEHKVPPEPLEPTPPYVDSWGKVETIIFRFCAFLLTLVIISKIVDFVVVRTTISSALKNAGQEPALESIKFDNPYEYLPYGDDLNLTIEPTPDNADLKGLKYENSAPDIVRIVSKPRLHIRATEASENSKPCDVNIKAYMPYADIEDEIIIHVIKNGENEPRGEGTQK